MKKADGAIVVVREWLAKAENDLLAATHTLKLGRRCPTDMVCFHAQQCAEEISLSEARVAVAVARRLRKAMRAILPESATNRT